MVYITPSSDGFDRTLVDKHHISSLCRRCGAVIVGSVLDGLAELEASHMDECKKPNASIFLSPRKFKLAS
jgi:hypothetical protein